MSSFAQIDINSNSNKIIGNMAFKIIQYLDSGSFSQVYGCQIIENYSYTRLAVLKVTTSQEHMLSISKELELFRKLNATNSEYLKSFLVGFYAGEVTNHHACLLLEYCKMNLVQYMNTQLPSQLPTTTILHIIFDTTQALYFLHAHNIIHRDVKLENVLIRNLYQSNGYVPTYVLCDFGSCSTTTIPFNSMPTNIHEIKHEIDHMTTLWYRAPEMIDLHLKRGISTKVDIWALGCLMYKLIYYKNPFENEYGILSYNNNLSQLILNNNKPMQPQILSIMEKMLWVHPLERVSSWKVLDLLCELKGSKNPLENIFKEEVVQPLIQRQADVAAHPLMKIQQQSTLQQVQMSDMAQQRRQQRNRSQHSDFTQPIELPSEQPQFMQQPTLQPIQQTPQIFQQHQSIQEPFNPVQPTGNSQFPSLDEFEKGQLISIPQSYPNVLDAQQIDSTVNNSSPIVMSPPISHSPRKLSLKFQVMEQDPTVLMANILRSVDLQEIHQLLKWVWQQHNLNMDPVRFVLTEIRKLLSEVGVLTSNVRAIFRCSLTIHALLLYGPADVPKHQLLGGVLMALETVQNRTSKFYGSYLREYCALVQFNSLSGRYKSNESLKSANLSKKILMHFQINFDRFLNLRDAMGTNSDIALCLFLFIQDAMAGIAAASEIGEVEKSIKALVNLGLRKLIEVMDSTLSYCNGLLNDIPNAIELLHYQRQHAQQTAYIPEPKNGEIEINEDLNHFWWALKNQVN